MISSAFKKQLSPILQEGFVLKRAVFQSCLELYPMQEWNEVMRKMNALNRFVKKNNDFIRRFTAGVKVVELDASGRLLIPKDLCQFASIKKQVVLSSAINIIEIWDKDSYEHFLLHRLFVLITLRLFHLFELLIFQSHLLIPITYHKLI